MAKFCSSYANPIANIKMLIYNNLGSARAPGGLHGLQIRCSPRGEGGFDSHALPFLFFY